MAAGRTCLWWGLQRRSMPPVMRASLQRGGWSSLKLPECSAVTWVSPSATPSASVGATSVLSCAQPHGYTAERRTLYKRVLGNSIHSETFISLSWYRFRNRLFHVTPQILDWIKVWGLGWPLHSINRNKDFVHLLVCLGSMSCWNIHFKGSCPLQHKATWPL